MERAYFIYFFIGSLRITTAKKSKKEIGDMGYGAEHILIGGRLFPILSSLSNEDFKVYQRCLSTKMTFLLQIIGLRLDVHERSSIPSKKYNVDQKFIDTLFHIDKLQSKY